MKNKVALLLLLFSFSIMADVDFYQDSKRGFVWFETMPEKEKVKKKTPKPITIKAPEKFSWTKEREKLTASLNEALDRFVMNPKDLSAAKEFLTLQQQAFARSHQGVHTATLAKLMYPELDYERQAPHNPNAKLIRDQEIQAEQEMAAQELANTHSLMFFFAGRNKNSKVMGKTVKSFADKYGFVVTPITLDGATIAEYPKATLNANLVRHYDVQPPLALFALEPRTGIFFPLANRIASFSELEQVILGFKKFKEGKVTW